MPGQTLVSDFEDIVDAAVSMLMLRWQDTSEQLGPRPFGWEKGNKWSLLESYLELRDDPAAWQQMLTTYTMQVGEAAAVAKVVTDATAMERMLAREGQWDGSPETLQQALLAGGQVVRYQQALRRLSTAERGMKAAEKELAKPQALVSGPLTGLMSEQELITGVAPAPVQPAYPPSPYVTGLPLAMPPPAPFGSPQQMPQPQGVMG